MELHIISDAIQFVRRNPSMFFPSGEPDGLSCAHQLVAEALALGGTEVFVLRHASWWAVGSTLDWFLADRSGREQFEAILPLPEVGVNASRVEVVIAAFAQDVSTLHGDQVEVLQGASPPRELVARLRDRATVRAVLYRLRDDS